MLPTAPLIATLVVAAAHVAFMVLETFLWTTPTGRRIFGQSRDEAAITKVLAANQGVYNGALAALLAWAALTGRTDTVIAGLIFVIFVGIVGAITAKPTILLAQALPAAVALVLTLV